MSRCECKHYFEMRGTGARCERCGDQMIQLHQGEICTKAERELVEHVAGPGRIGVAVGLNHVNVMVDRAILDAIIAERRPKPRYSVRQMGENYAWEVLDTVLNCERRVCACFMEADARRVCSLLNGEKP